MVESKKKKKRSAKQEHHWFTDAVSTDEETALIAAHYARLHAQMADDEAKLALAVGVTPPQPHNILALDCEMVQVSVPGTYTDKDKERDKLLPAGLPKAPPRRVFKSALARVSIIDFYGNVLLDSFVTPDDPISDYKTEFSGITAAKLVGAPSFAEIQTKIKEIITDSHYVVGQSIDNDLTAMKIDIPLSRIRDTALFYKRFHPAKKTPGLKDLSKWCLNVGIQSGEHDSVIDSRVTLLLYRQQRVLWETTVPEHPPPVPYGEAQPPPIPCPPELPEAFRAAMIEFEKQMLEPQPAVAASPAPVLIHAPPIHFGGAHQPVFPFAFAKPVPHQLPMNPFSPIPAKFTTLPAVHQTPPPAAAQINPLFTSMSPIPGVTAMPEPTVPVPIVTTSTPTQLLTTAQIIQSFYPKTMHASLLKGHDEKMMRLGAPPYWLVHPGTPIDETVNQISYDAVVSNLQAAEELAREEAKAKFAAKKVKMDTSLPGKRKREKLAAAAAAATLAAKTGEPLSETVANVKMFLDIATKDVVPDEAKAVPTTVDSDGDEDMRPAKRAKKSKDDKSEDVASEKSASDSEDERAKTSKKTKKSKKSKKSKKVETSDETANDSVDEVVSKKVKKSKKSAKVSDDEVTESVADRVKSSKKAKKADVVEEPKREKKSSKKRQSEDVEETDVKKKSKKRKAVSEDEAEEEDGNSKKKSKETKSRKCKKA
ncbi:3'-5' exonuclease [Chytriomyces hyalinus]|nr:3'-5' exonuclease [Chytriomyces hyalinus]